jgi:hypothetical protein
VTRVWCTGSMDLSLEGWNIVAADVVIFEL